MKKQEALNRIEAQKETIIELTGWAVFRYIEALLEQIDEPETGHSDEAPRYVKNILARLRELPEHDREVWLKVIMGEFERDFSRAKWREGYEQGKVEGMIEREKVTIPQFMADYIDISKFYVRTLHYALENSPEKVNLWLCENEINRQNTFARAWLDGYEVEKEKRYLVKIKGICGNHETLNREKHSNKWLFSDREENSLYGTHHTRKELEDAGFGEVFNSPVFEVVEVE